MEELTPASSGYPGLNQGDLLSIGKPAQYLGGEKNLVLKREQDVDVHFALAFPDTYEVGMSHVGIQILYDLMNRDEGSWAERVYMPFPDMEALLKEKGLPLCSLEAKRPLGEFDVIGFSLQYELCGTNILSMLDLGRIPLLACDRGPGDPIILGGGPYSYHPEALAPIFDILFLGDAEQFVPELLSAIREAKAAGTGYRSRLYDLLRGQTGVYIPSDYEVEYSENGSVRRIAPKELGQGRAVPPQVTRRLLPSLEGAPFPKKPVVPSVKAVHDRLSVEVMRGCVRGCRFCQAGYLYRPQRERSPREVMEIIKEALPETGFEEVSLLSLSTADYCSVVPLLKQIMDRYGEGDTLAVSFPSTRVDALTPEVLEQVQRVRRTGFTIAPEAGTQRLRDVINKGVSDEQILETCGNVFRMGWTGIKLYFMIGLPTETDEDLQGIIETARRIKRLPEANGKNITVSASTHVPKPHTPFQWAAQITPEETIRKQRLLADGLRRTGVNFRYHDHFSSFLEGIFCRAGRELTPVLVRAFQLGSRLDAWQDHLDPEKWMQAFAECNVNPAFYLRERAPDEPLPWDHLSCDIPKAYFLKEYRRALRDRTTPDCLTASCSTCGACDYDVSKNVLWPRFETEAEFASGSADRAENGVRVSAQLPVQRVRCTFTKTGNFRFLGHLEFATQFHRMLRRSKLPVCYTLGFHPMPRVVFGPPLPLGVASAEEFVDIYLYEPVTAEALLIQSREALPPGIDLLTARSIPLNAPSLQEDIVELGFRFGWISEPQGALQGVLSTDDPGRHLATLLDLTVTREKQGSKGSSKKRRSFLLADHVGHLSLMHDESSAGGTKSGTSGGPNGLEFSLRITPSLAGPNCVEVVRAISELSVADAYIEKTYTKCREAAQ